MIMAQNSQCLMNGCRLGYRFRNILVLANTRSSSMILSHISAFWKKRSAERAHNEAQIYHRFLLICILCVYIVQMLFAWINCAEEHSRFWFTWLWQRKQKKINSNVDAWAIFPTHLLSDAPLTPLSCCSYTQPRAASLHHFSSSPFMCEMYFYIQSAGKRRSEGGGGSGGSDTSDLREKEASFWCL